MKITASVDSKLGDKVLERGKTYDVKEQEGKHLVRAGLARLPKKNARVEATAKAAQVSAPTKPGDQPAPRKDGK